MFGFMFGIGLCTGMGRDWRSNQVLIKTLPKIAARILKNTWGVPPQYKQKLELVHEAYGEAAVLTDFEKWCHEVKCEAPRYPISEYLKVVDIRLGTAPAEITEKDPRVDEISALVYRLTRRVASGKLIRELLAQFDAEDIKSAFIEYAEGIEERELAYAAKAFFQDGGCAAIITARNFKNQERIEKLAREQREKEISDAQIDILKRESDAKLEEIRRKAALPKQTGEELFG